MFDKLFDISSVQNLFDSLSTAASQTAAAKKEEAAVVVEEKEKITDSAAGYAQHAQEQLTRLQTIEGQGNEARRLADSDNIFDRVTLIGEQILNPRAYTRAGRQGQISEISQDLAARGQIHGIETNLSVAKMEEAQAKTMMVEAGVNADMSSLRAKVDGLQLMNQMMYQTETLRQQNLIQQDLPTLQKTMMGPTGQTGKFSIGGMEYAPAELKEREKALMTRDQLAMLSPQATDPEYASKLRVHHDLQLANYSLPELELLKAGQYKMSDGTQVDPQIWDAHYNRQNQMMQDSMSRQANEAMLSNTLPVIMKESMQLATNVGNYAAPGTPLSIAKQNFLQAANVVSQISDSAQGKTPTGQVQAVTMMQKAQGDFIKAIDTEATRKSAGDKELANIYRSQMLGEQIQPAQIEDLMRTRYVKSKGFSDFLPSDVSTRVKKSADNHYAKLKQAAAQNYNSMDGSKSDKELKEEALNLALEDARMDQGNIGINMILQQETVRRKDNPAIKANMVPEQIRQTMVRAHSSALETLADNNKLTPEQVMAIKMGVPETAGISPERYDQLVSELNGLSIQYEYFAWENQKPGLGYEMQQWFGSVLPDMAREYTSKLDPITQVMTGDSVLAEARSVVDSYTMAENSASDRGRQMAIETATGARKPENMWPVLLHNNKRLADPQKQALFYDVIQPAIQSARSQGKNDENTTAAVFDALNQFKSDDSATMSALKITMRELPTQLEDFQTMWTYILAQNQPNLRRVSLLKNNPEEASAQIRSVIPWLKK